MGKTKSKLIKRSANILIKKGNKFDEDFKENKKILGDTMPSKKVKNQMAGFLSKLKKTEKKQNQ